MSDSNISKWDFKLQEHNNYQNQFVTPVLGESFFVGEYTKKQLNDLNLQNQETFMDLQRNMETHIYDLTKKECNEALFEKNRLLKRANQFNHRPEKREQILNQAQELKQLD